MTDLIEFLKARLDDDERKANAELAFARHETIIASRDRRRTPGKVPCGIQEMDDRATWMLREVEAKRETIALYTRAIGAAEHHHEATPRITVIQDETCVSMLTSVLVLLAAVYRGHPDWRQEWTA